MTCGNQEFVKTFGDPDCADACADPKCRVDTQSVVTFLMGVVRGDHR